MTSGKCFLLCTPCKVDGIFSSQSFQTIDCLSSLDYPPNQQLVPFKNSIQLTSLPQKYSPRCRKESQSQTYPRKSSQISTRTSTALPQSSRSTAPPAKTISSGNSTQHPSLAQSSITKSPISLQRWNCSTSKKRSAMSTLPRTAFRRSNKRSGTRCRGMKRAAI